MKELKECPLCGTKPVASFCCNGSEAEFIIRCECGILKRTTLGYYPEEGYMSKRWEEIYKKITDACDEWNTRVCSDDQSNLNSEAPRKKYRVDNSCHEDTATCELRLTESEYDLLKAVAEILNDSSYDNYAPVIAIEEVTQEEKKLVQCMYCNFFHNEGYEEGAGFCEKHNDGVLCSNWCGLGERREENEVS